MKKINKIDMVDFLERKLNIREVKEEESLLRIIDELYDLKNDNVMPLDVIETFIFRKRYGLLDNGVPQTKERICRENNISYSKVEKILGSVMTKLLFRIKKIDKHEKVEKLSSFDIYKELSCYENISVFTLPLHTLSKNKLMQNYIFTLKDLMEYSLIELKSIISKEELENLITYFHSLGLYFIDEIKSDDRKELIKNSPFLKVINSSIYWLNSTKGIAVTKFKNNNISDIKSLILNMNFLLKGDQIKITKELASLNLGISMGKKGL